MQDAFQYVDDNLDRFIQELCEYCAQPSIAAQNVGMAQTAELTKALMERAGITAQVIPTTGYPVVYGEVKGSSSRCLLFYNHYDVQPPDPLDEWISGPFEPEVREGKVFGRGTADNKGNLLSRIHAVEALLETRGELPCTVKFLVEGEEEIGSPSLERFVDQHRHLLNADACVWESAFKNEDDLPVVRLGHKGMLYVELEAKGPRIDYHSRSAAVLPNPAWRLVHALATLSDGDGLVLIKGFYDSIAPISPEEEQLLASLPPMDEKLRTRSGVERFVGNAAGAELTRRLYTFPTCNISGIASGYGGPGQKTIVPAKALAKLDIRLVVKQDPDDIMRKLRHHLDEHGYQDVEVRVLSKAKPFKTPLNSWFAKLVIDAAARVYGSPIMVEPTSAGTSPCYVIGDWSDMPIVGLGVGWAGSQNHAPNENVRITDYQQGTKHIIAVIEALGST